MHHKNTIIIINVICRDNKGSTNNETVKKVLLIHFQSNKKDNKKWDLFIIFL